MLPGFHIIQPLQHKRSVKFMDIIKIIGIGLISLIIVIILKQYKPEYAIYVSLAAGILIFALSLDKLSRNNRLANEHF